MKCRHCGSEIATRFLDLGSSPPSNAYLNRKELNLPEKWFPLRVLVCSHCWLVQTEDKPLSADLFTSDYAYFSSFSSTWLNHAKKYVEEVVERFKLNNSSYVIEIAANDGYLLQFFKKKNILCLGIEPTTSTANAARKKGINILEEFFSLELSERLDKEGKNADLIIANNVLAHVPDINDFVSGISKLLKKDGIVTFEFPHLFQLVLNNQFDTIYHEHYSYLSLISVKHIFERNNLSIFDIEELSTHGGSLRVFASHKNSNRFEQSKKVTDILSREEKVGMKTIEYYSGFQSQANIVKNEFLLFLLDASRQNKKVIGYGAAAKGNTLLNYAGIRKDLIEFVVDLNPSKTGKFLPGSHIPIVEEDWIKRTHPNYVVIFPWNLKTEITNQLSYIREWDGKFVIAIPKLEIL